MVIGFGHPVYTIADPRHQVIKRVAKQLSQEGVIPAALFFFGAGMLFPLATSGAMEPFPLLTGTAGALVGGVQNSGSGVLASLTAMMPQSGQGSLGLLMTLMGLLIVLCWLDRKSVV